MTSSHLLIRPKYIIDAGRNKKYCIFVNNPTHILKLVRDAATKKVLFMPHAIRQMTRPDRMITTDEVRSVLEKGELIEDYQEDPRGHSCLLLGCGQIGRPIHVVCSPKQDFVAIITAYVPDLGEWSEDFRIRRMR